MRPVANCKREVADGADSEPSNKREEETKSNEQPDSKNVTKHMMNTSLSIYDKINQLIK